MANYILQNRGDSPLATVGIHWVNNLVKRYSEELIEAYRRSLDYKRAKAEDPALIQDWFRLVANIKQHHGIQDADIYNMDEIGFLQGYIQSAKVITRTEHKAIHIQPGNRA